MKHLQLPVSIVGPDEAANLDSVGEVTKALTFMESKDAGCLGVIHIGPTWRQSIYSTIHLVESNQHHSGVCPRDLLFAGLVALYADDINSPAIPSLIEAIKASGNESEQALIYEQLQMVAKVFLEPQPT